MRLLITTLLLSFSSFLIGQTDTSHFIKVHFLYGSKPLKKYKNKTEMKYFGGMHGGHVTIEVDSIDYGFSPSGRVHMISHPGKHHSQFDGKHTHNQAPYPKGYKVATFIIPVTQEQYTQIKQIENNYCARPPYDYAFIGMRCAASAEEILGQLGIVKKKKRLGYVFTTFYPKKLRKRLFKMATKNKYKIVTQDGRPTRKWERD